MGANTQRKTTDSGKRALGFILYQNSEPDYRGPVTILKEQQNPQEDHLIHDVHTVAFSFLSSPPSHYRRIGT